MSRQAYYWSRQGLTTPFGLWLLGWWPRFRFLRNWDAECGWMIDFLNGRILACHIVRPDYDVRGRHLVFRGFRMFFKVGPMAVSYHRAPRIPRRIPLRAGA